MLDSLFYVHLHPYSFLLITCQMVAELAHKQIIIKDRTSHCHAVSFVLDGIVSLIVNYCHDTYC